ncbi:hypothetical protein SBRCBS47491_004032 [Sporothrix bragantina]|uniref:Ankyrin repeat protein n=1 Tax=Sporothrix bragantina TaxID=671064 RepID=A0ABP0BL85_9PEZI
MEEKKTRYTIAGHEFVLTDQIAQAAGFVLWAKDWIGDAVQASPEASIAWAGVCLILPLLTNPTTTAQANRDGFTYVTTRMRYYIALEPLLRRLGQNAGVADGLIAEANNHIIDLYQHILEFQIQSVLRFYQSCLKGYAGDVFLPKGWNQMRLKIEQLEATQLVVSKAHRDIAQKQLALQQEIQQDAVRQKLSDEQKNNDKNVTYEWYKDRVEDRIQGTCLWFLRHDHFQRWLAQESGPLLVSADPGCGKSVLAKYLIDHELSQQSATICYYFFKDQDQNTARQALYNNPVVRLLLENGADVEAKGRLGWTPLSLAAGLGLEALAQLLLENGADVETKDNNGQTPLSLAAELGLEAVARLLLEKGADVKTKDNSGRTPLSYAADRDNEAVARLLLEKGADVDAKDDGGWTPLSLAADGGHETVARLLLEKGADVEAKDDDGRTPLSLAADGGHEAVARLLVEKGADVDAKDDDGRTPLSLAADGGHEAVARLLVEKGAEPSLNS